MSTLYALYAAMNGTQILLLEAGLVQIVPKETYELNSVKNITPQELISAAGYALRLDANHYADYGDLPPPTGKVKEILDSYHVRPIHEEDLQ